VTVINLKYTQSLFYNIQELNIYRYSKTDINYCVTVNTIQLAKTFNYSLTMPKTYSH